MVGKPKTAEMHPGPGFRLREDVTRPQVEAWEPLRDFPTPAISDQMNRLYTMASDIRVMTDPSHLLVGPACTVKCYPGDNLMVHKALDVARPGDVVCVDASASGTTAVLGDLVSTKARHRGIAGLRRRTHTRLAGHSSSGRLSCLRSGGDTRRPSASRPGRDQLSGFGRPHCGPSRRHRGGRPQWHRRCPS